MKITSGGEAWIRAQVEALQSRADAQDAVLLKIARAARGELAAAEIFFSMHRDYYEALERKIKKIGESDRDLTRELRVILDDLGKPE